MRFSRFAEILGGLKVERERKSRVRVCRASEKAGAGSDCSWTCREGEGDEGIEGMASSSSSTRGVVCVSAALGPCSLSPTSLMLPLFPTQLPHATRCGAAMGAHILPFSPPPLPT